MRKRAARVEEEPLDEYPQRADDKNASGLAGSSCTGNGVCQDMHYKSVITSGIRIKTETYSNPVPPLPEVLEGDDVLDTDGVGGMSRGTCVMR